MTFISTTFPLYSQGLAKDPTTRSLWYSMAMAHDYENHDYISSSNIYKNIFISHFAQISIILLWTTANLYHISTQGNYAQWKHDPNLIRPIAHNINDPHFSNSAMSVFTRGGSATSVNICTSGLYHILYTLGINNNNSIFIFNLYIILLLFIIFISIIIHNSIKFNNNLHITDNNNSVALENNILINHHINILSLGSLLLSLHYIFNFNNINNNLNNSADSVANKLYLDIIHHHIAISIIFIIFIHIINNIKLNNNNSADSVANNNNYSMHFQLSIILSVLGICSSLMAQHVYSIPSFIYIINDITTISCIYIHHQYIAGFLMIGSFAHASIYIIRDYSINNNSADSVAINNNFAWKEMIISHLSYI